MSTPSIRVLIVDDSPEFLGVASAFVRARAGVELIGALTSGREALERVGELRPDLVLVDLVMPVMSGLELTRKMREAGCNSRIFVCTFYESDFYRVEALAAGADGFLSKTRFVEDLTELIDAYPGGRAKEAGSA